ncbi:MAG: M24 family metallopeptidase [Planctomycetaceae bacterium]
MFEGAFSGLGFQLKERPWEQPVELLWQDLCRGRRVATDGCVAGCEAVPAELADFRQQYSGHETSALKELGRDLAHALEATARHCEPGETESEIAGQIAHRLTHHQATPVQLQVAGDGRRARFRHWAHSDTPVRRFVTLSAVARRQGLHVAATRTVCFGDAPKDLVDAHHHASMVLAIGMFFSKTGWTIGECWSRVARIYEKFGAPDEWRLSDQGELTGYRPCEVPIVPGGAGKFQTGHIVSWHPSIRTAAVGETIQVQPEGFLHLTNSPNWPKLGIQVKGTEILLPAILCRDATSEWCIG